MKLARCAAHASYQIEDMKLADLAEVLAIEEVSFENPWPREAFEHEISKNRFSHPKIARRASAGPQPVAGFCIYWMVFRELHIQNIAVHPDHRGRGLGRYLLEEALFSGWRAGALSAVLEVRESNRVARELYRSLGFRETGRRKSYYTYPREDAILYQMDAPGPHERRSPR